MSTSCFRFLAFPLFALIFVPWFLRCSKSVSICAHLWLKSAFSPRFGLFLKINACQTPRVYWRKSQFVCLCCPATCIFQNLCQNCPVSRKTTRTCLRLPPQAEPGKVRLKRLVAVVALRPVRLVTPKRSEGGRPAQRGGGGIRSASLPCPNFVESGTRASVWTAASSAPLWSERPPGVRLPVARTASGSIDAPLSSPQTSRANAKALRSLPWTAHCPLARPTLGPQRYLVAALCGPARISPVSPFTLQRFIAAMKITKRTQFQNGISTFNSILLAISAAFASEKRTQFSPDIPRGWDSLSPAQLEDAFQGAGTAFPRPRRVAKRVEPASSRWFRASHPKRGALIPQPAFRSPPIPQSELRNPNSMNPT